LADKSHEHLNSELGLQGFGNKLFKCCYSEAPEKGEEEIIKYDS
jgi:hypothetical protein